MAPLYEGTAESLRTIVTIAGGALVTSVSVVQFVADEITRPTAGWLLPTSWILFVITIIGAMTAQAALTGMRLFRHHAIREVNRIIAAEAIVADDASIREAIVSRTAQHHDVELKRYNASANVTRASFVVAFIAMILFAIINLPF